MAIQRRASSRASEPQAAKAQEEEAYSRDVQ